MACQRQMSFLPFRASAGVCRPLKPMEGPGVLQTGPCVWVLCGNTTQLLDLLQSQTPSSPPLLSQAAVTSYCPLLGN